jgi:excisionase family DNA binding protein
VERIQVEKRWVRREEIATRMGVRVTVVTKWVNAGLLTPVATHANTQHFSRDEVDAFVQGHIFSDEAARILGVGLDVVQKWARKGRLEPVAGGNHDDCHRYLFRREDVERLRPENRLTGPQLAKRLGLSRAQLWQWIKHGKVKPVSGPGIDGSRHYLFVLLEN